MPVIEADVDGPNALPLRLDGDIPNLGRFAACRRVARTIYLGFALTATAAHRGIEERQVKLGCIMPGETAPVFGDALRRLSAAATYLYHDGTRYWYSTQPTVTKLAEDRAEQLTRNPDKVVHELDKRVRADVRNTGDFPRVHALPPSGYDVPDDMDARLVVLGSDHPYSKEPGNLAETAAEAIFERRGNTPRLFGNTLVFLVLDKVRLQDLDEAIRRYVAWKSILDEREELNLDPQQVRQAETQLASADGAVTARLPEAYQWLLVPVQTSPQAPVEWQALRLSGQDALAVRASKKLRNDELLVTAFAGTNLRGELDRIPLWRGNHVAIKQLAEDFARYIYLPRLAGPAVLSSAIQDGLGLLTWEKESFAYADDFDEKAGRYRGLRHGKIDSLSPGALIGLLVRPEIAKQQLELETKPPEKPPEPPGKKLPPEEPPKLTRFHGSVVLDPTRVGRDAGRIADEIVSHLVGLMGSTVTVTLEIGADIPSGVPDKVVRDVTENCRTLKFTSQGFETE